MVSHEKQINVKKKLWEKTNCVDKFEKVFRLEDFVIKYKNFCCAPEWLKFESNIPKNENYFELILNLQ